MIFLQPESVLMSVARVTTEGHAESQLEGLLMSMLQAAPKGLVWVCDSMAAKRWVRGLCCPQWKLNIRAPCDCEEQGGYSCCDITNCRYTTDREVCGRLL